LKSTLMSIEVKDSAVPGVHGNIFRNAKVGPSLSAFGGALTLYEVFQHSVNKFPENPCIGYRPINENGEAGEYLWLTYAETSARAVSFAAGLIKLGLCPPLDDFKFGILGFYAKNRIEWTVGEQACGRMNIVPVPLYDTLGPESVSYVINQTLMTTVLCTTEVAPNVLKAVAAGSSSMKNIVLMDGRSDQDANVMETRQLSQQLTAGAVQVFAWDTVEEVGYQNPVKPNAPSSRDIAFFCYTSGTTGNPKGALISHENMVSGLATVINGEASMVVRDDGSSVHLSYLPLPHVFERLNQMCMFAYGGRVGYYQGDPLKILDDLVALRPTFFPSVPRLLSRIHDKIMAGVSEAGGMKAALFQRALAAKVSALRTDKEGAGTLTHRLWDTLVFNPLKKRLGLDRCEVLITGSAPLSPEVMNFLRAAFGVPVMEGYGQTESSAVGTVTDPYDFTTGHVGVPSSSNEIALFDCPEMGYLSTDTTHASDGSVCRGRGEICFRGVNVFKGYYKMPEKTADAIDENGWLHSGDIGVWTQDGKLRIVDRKKNIFKLSQGEYIAPEKIENVYAGSPLVLMSFVYGDSLQSHLVAVVVPDEEAIRLWASKPGSGVAKGGEGASFKQLCADPIVHAAVVADLNRIAKSQGLHGFEHAKAFYLEDIPFSVEAGILTPTFKLKRQEARDHYRGVLDQLYDQVATKSSSGPKPKL